MLTNKKLNKLLQDGYDQMSVEKKDLYDMPVEKAKGDEWYLASGTAQEKRYPVFFKLSLAMACLLLMFLGMNTYRTNFRSFATICLDVNPSIEVSINRNEKVLQVNALNEDAEKIIDGMDFKGSDLKVTVNALIGSLVRKGYINEINNSILVSVSDTDWQSGEHLEQELLDEISKLIDNGSILSQQVITDDVIRTLSKDYGISLGKAQLIKEICDGSNTYTYEELAGLTIHELNLLNKRNEGSITHRQGEPNDQAYIGIRNAIQAALDHAGISGSNVFINEAELDYENGRMIYEVEFRYEGYDYEYKIDALNAAVLHSKKTRSSATSTSAAAPSVDKIISQEEAKRNALSHAGLSEAQITDLKIELEYEDGILKYEIEFDSDGQEYDYEVDASSGKILKSEKEPQDEDDDHEDADDIDDRSDDDRDDFDDHDDHDDDLDDDHDDYDDRDDYDDDDHDDIDDDDHDDRDDD